MGLFFGEPSTPSASLVLGPSLDRGLRVDLSQGPVGIGDARVLRFRGGGEVLDEEKAGRVDVGDVIDKDLNGSVARCSCTLGSKWSGAFWPGKWGGNEA